MPGHLEVQDKEVIPIPALSWAEDRLLIYMNRGARDHPGGGAW